MRIEPALLLMATIATSSVFAADESQQNKTWPSYMEVLEPYVAKSDAIPQRLKEDPQLRQELNRFMTFVDSMGYFGLLYQNTKYPDFWPVYNQAYPLGFHNPDDAYYMAVVDDDGVYKISGYRGTVRILEFQILSGTMQPYGHGAFGPPRSHYDIDQGVRIGKDGEFEVILSPSRPAGYQGAWWKLEPGSTAILVRQRAYDWLREVDGRLAIERMDVPAMRPRMSAAEIQEAVNKSGTWVQNWTTLMTQWPVRLRKLGLVNKVALTDLSQSAQLGVAGGIPNQKYIQGTFEVGPDEALILETEVPKTCRYWMFHLLDEMMSSIDVLNRQTSLNGYQAHLDSDGKFRAVISARDPAVPNWLDTVGYSQGVIMGRWWACSSAPEPTISKVKFADVRNHLPADTPTVSAAQRDEDIRKRRKGAQLRRRW